MASFNYKVRRQKDGSPIIYIQFSYGRGKLFRPSTGFELKSEEHWDSGKQRIKDVIAEPSRVEWNKKLRDIKKHIEDGYDSLLAADEPINNNVLKALFESLSESAQATKKKKPFDFIELMDQWVSYSENDKRTAKGKKLAKGTIKTYSNTKEVIKLFIEDNPILSPSKIDKSIYLKLLTYLEGKSYSLNYTGKIVKNLKTFFSYVVNDLEIVLPEYKAQDWKVLKEEVNEIYLTNAELMKMFYLDLSGMHKDYSRARDLFLISAFTGLRISDNKRLEKESIIELEGMRFFQIESQKTGNEVIIPISKIVEQIIERNGGFPAPMADQRVNKLIKDVGESVGVDEAIRLKRTEGGKGVERDYMKFQLIKTHTARRSFCTNAYLGGMDTLSIMAVSGHKSEENFLRYIKVTKKEQAIRSAKSEYFLSLNAENFSEKGERKLKAV